MNSRHKERFLKAVEENRYIGVEAFIPLKPLLPVVQCDIMDYEPEQKFDAIFLMDVIEHIQFRDWFVLFPRLRSWLNVGGTLILTMPYDENIRSYLYCDEGEKTDLMIHVVFGIDEEIIKRFLPDARFRRAQYFQKILKWREGGENHVRALVRFIKRRLTGHRHGRIIERRKRMSVLWKKET